MAKKRKNKTIEEMEGGLSPEDLRLAREEAEIMSAFDRIKGEIARSPEGGAISELEQAYRERRVYQAPARR